MKEVKDFYDTLRENLQNFRGKYDSYIDYGPELFKLLVDLLGEEKVDSEGRKLINAALAYYIAPKDVIPEEIYGPFGYVDDIFVCIYVIKLLEKKFGYDLLVEYWDGESELKAVVDECYEKSKEVVKDEIDEILKYVGLK
jgi:uncharacterized membrane protein YkvA (DUF1232 family)